MQRRDLETWFATHPQSTEDPPKSLLDQCESEVREHAYRDAWIHAKEIAEESLHRFERVFGLPASDVFVTREVCHEIARELRRHEPHPDDLTASRWVRSAPLDALDSEARRLMADWLRELAEKEEHAAWREIVYFTDHLARKLIDQSHMTSQLDWDFDRSYPRVAARVARMLISEFESHAEETIAGLSHATKRH